MTPAMVIGASAEITKIVFLHRALESQKAWMRKYIKKPEDMQTRVLAATISKNNNVYSFSLGAW